MVLMIIALFPFETLVLVCSLFHLQLSGGKGRVVNVPTSNLMIASRTGTNLVMGKTKVLSVFKRLE
jgi:hypothetical protein